MLSTFLEPSCGDTPIVGQSLVRNGDAVRVRTRFRSRSDGEAIAGPAVARKRRLRAFLLRPLLLLLAGSLRLALPSLACAAQAQRPNVVLIVIDTLRADRVAGYGRRSVRTVKLLHLETLGVTFRHAYAASSWTPPSIASIFTSRYPSQHLVGDLTSVLSGEESTLAEVLTAHGYTSLGFSANGIITPEGGYGQGFRAFAFVPGRRPKTRGDELREAALSVIDQECKPPCFLYFQFVEPHWPYRPPPPFRKMYGRNQSLFVAPSEATCDLASKQAETKLNSMDYDGEVAEADRQVGRLFTELERRGLLNNAIIIVTSDHGEEFLEHGGLGHGTTLFGELVHVPLIIVAPGIQGFRTVDRNVSLLDLAPTILDLLGIAPEPRFEGESLTAILHSGGRGPGFAHQIGERSDRGILFELPVHSLMHYYQKHQAAFLRGTRKIVVSRDGGGHEEYDLRLDPGERNPIQPVDAALLAELEAARHRFAGRTLGAPSRRELDAVTRERMRKLGYGF